MVIVFEKIVFTDAPVTFLKLLIIAVNKVRATIKRENGKYNIKDDPTSPEKEFGKKRGFYMEIFFYLVTIASKNKSSLSSRLSKAE